MYSVVELECVIELDCVVELDSVVELGCSRGREGREDAEEGSQPVRTMVWPWRVRPHNERDHKILRARRSSWAQVPDEKVINSMWYKV